MKPNLTIFSNGRPYLRRWFLTPWAEDGHPLKAKRLPNVYLHHLLGDDDDRALHDHPWENVSVILWGGYTEHVFAYEPRVGQPSPPVIQHRRRMFSVVRRRAELAHRIELHKKWNYMNSDQLKPCWSLFLTWRKRREWGFWCEERGIVGSHEITRRETNSSGATIIELRSFGMVAKWVHQKVFNREGCPS